MHPGDWVSAYFLVIYLYCIPNTHFIKLRVCYIKNETKERISCRRMDLGWTVGTDFRGRMRPAHP